MQDRLAIARKFHFRAQVHIDVEIIAKGTVGGHPDRSSLCRVRVGFPAQTPGGQGDPRGKMRRFDEPVPSCWRIGVPRRCFARRSACSIEAAPCDCQSRTPLCVPRGGAIQALIWGGGRKKSSDDRRLQSRKSGHRSFVPRVDQRASEPMDRAASSFSATVFGSSLGWFGVVWNGEAVARLTFGHQAREEALAAIGEACPPVLPEDCPDPRLVARLRDYAEGHPDNFSDVIVDTGPLTPFGQRVRSACRAIPYGGTSSYAALAEQAGSPKAARAVGQCMAGNRVPLIVPCHRVVGALGRLGGFSAPGGTSLKRQLLDLESR
ncbi:MAG: methylated-DNA--[protein]-cysteine S-methyltransferase [Thermoguttaceae bacterium]